MFNSLYYKIFVCCLVLIPNIFVISLGLESFPYTCAPMFGHYIDDDTSLYLLKFEGIDEDEKVDLKDYLGKNEILFMRHFFCKFYGVNKNISPFSNWLKDSETSFSDRMSVFFSGYNDYLSTNHNFDFKEIKVSILKVDRHRQPLSTYEELGTYNTNLRIYTPNL